MNDIKKDSQLYKTYIDYSPTPLFVANSHAEYVFVNKASEDLLGYTREELLTFTFNNIIFKEDTENIFASFEKLKNTGKIEEDIRLKAKDGKEVYVKLKAVALPTGNVLAYCTDISHLKKVEEELKNKLEKLEKVNKYLVDRENIMIELKNEIVELKKQVSNS